MTETEDMQRQCVAILNVDADMNDRYAATLANNPALASALESGAIALRHAAEKILALPLPTPPAETPLVEAIAALVSAVQDCASQAMSAEIPEGYGPDITDHPEFHRGFDAAISRARTAHADLIAAGYFRNEHVKAVETPLVEWRGAEAWIGERMVGWATLDTSTMRWRWVSMVSQKGGYVGTEPEARAAMDADSARVIAAMGLKKMTHGNGGR